MGEKLTLAEREMLVRERTAGITARDVARKERKQRLMELGVVESIIGGRSVFGQLIKWFIIISIILLLGVGPILGTLSQMTQYLSSTIVFWLLGLVAIIIYIRRR